MGSLSICQFATDEPAKALVRATPSAKFHEPNAQLQAVLSSC